MYAVPRGDGLYGRLALVHDARIRKVEVDAKPVDVARSRRDAAVAQVQAEQVAVLGWELVERVLGWPQTGQFDAAERACPGNRPASQSLTVLTGSPVRAAIRRAPDPGRGARVRPRPQQRPACRVQVRRGGGWGGSDPHRAW